MVHTEKIRLLAKQAAYLISIHTVLYILYNYTHGKLDLLYLAEAYAPITLLFCLAPFAVVFMLFTPSARWAAVALLGFLPAELIYNIYTRFSAARPFTVAEPLLVWKIVYECSFGLVLMIEVIAVWLIFKLLVEIHKQLDVEQNNP
ncbi:MAG: hypothetical protein EHM64_14610 [Ignavibacteriae bacterium]|nr:MAG: hypothetical protein EHM64_14610 [Ignavibacteriota bacterium]